MGSLAGLFDGLRAQRRAVLAALAALAAAGLWLAVSLPVSLLPDIIFPRITVIADSGERPGVEMERSVTRPLEAMLRRVPSIREMRSTTSRGSTEINLDCDWGTNMNLALQQVQAQIDAARERLPAGTAVDARLMSPTLFPVYGFSRSCATSRRCGSSPSWHACRAWPRWRCRAGARSRPASRSIPERWRRAVSTPKGWPRRSAARESSSRWGCSTPIASCIWV
jgi:hypothetical protein